MPATSPILTVVPDELRLFARLAPLATISPVSATVRATLPLCGPMPESNPVEAHVRFCVEHTGTIALDATNGISTLIEAAYRIAALFELVDESSAVAQQQLTNQLPSATDDGTAARV